MPFTRIAGRSFFEMARACEDAADELTDNTGTLERVVQPYMMEHVDRNVRTAGKYSDQSFNFDGEDQYRANKTVLMGEPFGSFPFLVTPAEAILLPSLTDPNHPMAQINITPDGIDLGSNVEYVEALLLTGGVGPFGEPFPARNPYIMNSEQHDELDELILEDIAKRVHKHLPED